MSPTDRSEERHRLGCGAWRNEACTCGGVVSGEARQEGGEESTEPVNADAGRNDQFDSGTGPAPSSVPLPEGREPTKAERYLALKLCELGEVPDPRLEDLRPVDVRELAQRNLPAAFAGKRRSLSDAQVVAILAKAGLWERVSLPAEPSEEAWQAFLRAHGAAYADEARAVGWSFAEAIAHHDDDALALRAAYRAESRTRQGE